tara:strand:+ start:22838 stop:23794 length:957 start_codon:yes stop_codon:yes gene_type:complete
MNNSFNNKVVVVTGGSGYIGSSLINSLKSKPRKIIRVSRQKLNPENEIEDWQLDLSLNSSWLKIVSEADVIFHLSGNTSVYKAEKNEEESLISNVTPVNMLINAAKELSRRPRVIFASTATVYGLTEKIPVFENLMPNPITVYDSHKYLVEKKLSKASEENIISAVSLRFSNVFGPSLIEASESDRGILSKVVRLALEGESIKIYGDGDFIRDYIYIEDVVEALIQVSIITSRKSIFNVASGIGTSLKDVFSLVASEIEKATGNKVHITNVEWPKGVSRIEKRNFVASIDLLMSETSWCPKVSLKRGIQLLIRDYIDE